MSRNRPQHEIGHRPFCNWGAGPAQAKYAVGSVVYLPPGCSAVIDGRATEGLHRVESCFSIGEDASFYYRVSPTEIIDGRRLKTDWSKCSDRLHVIPGRFDYTAGWVLLWVADSAVRPAGVEGAA